jgi:plasmid stabilization system protein ParE
MAYKIVSSKIFLRKVIALNSYLETEWNHAVATDFHSRLLKIILTVAEQPSISSPALKKKNVRRILITKHNRLYYRVNENSITLLTLFDTRLNLKKNRFG